MACLAACLAIPLDVSVQPRSEEAYVITPASRLEVSTGKAGVLGFAGHEHLIRARAFAGRVVYVRENPPASSVTVVVRADSLDVLTPPDTAEIRQVTVAMRDQVLEVDRYPEIRFASTAARVLPAGLELRGNLMMHGQTRPVTIDLRTGIGNDTLRASGRFSVLQTDFGIRPYRGGPGGTVRVADRITFDLDVVAIRDGSR